MGVMVDPGRRRSAGPPAGRDDEPGVRLARIPEQVPLGEGVRRAADQTGAAFGSVGIAKSGEVSVRCRIGRAILLGPARNLRERSSERSESMAGKTVVLAFFKDEAAADDAVESLKAWDKADRDIKLDAIGVLALDDQGKIKTHKLGKRSVGKGAGIGLVLAVIAPPTLLAGVIGGGLLGAFHHKGLGLKAADRDRIAAQLTRGQAAVGVLVVPAMAIDVSAKLTQLGGTAEVHEVTEEAVAEVETAVPAVEAAEMAAGDDLSILDGVGPKYADALRAAGVTTFAQLSEMTPEAIEATLVNANVPLIAGHNADTWPRQAKLAAAQEWSALRRYIDSTKKVATG
jgi:predicted flap endonuclease-1-like 5' DNA nuclease